MGCVESSTSANVSQTSKSIPDGVCSQSQRDASCNTHEFLTSDERTTLKSDWELLSRVSHQDMGMRIFLRIFELEPSTKQSFPAFLELEHDSLMSNTLFRCHAARFMRAVAAAVDNIDALELVVVPNLIQLGQIHRSVSGLSLQHLDAFEQAMTEVWAGELLGSSAHCTRAWNDSMSAQVWGKVFRLITSKIYEGFQQSTRPTTHAVIAFKDGQQI